MKTATRKTSAGAVAYSYIRFSSAEQRKGDSLRRQTALCDDWCKRNGVRLDDTLKPEQGTSAFTGAHRKNPDRHSLAMFLEMVNQKRVAPGSYLVVESLDRLTREHIRPALTLLLNLIEAGVRVVQLIPAEVVYDEDVDPMVLMMAIMELNRGNSESVVKSDRLLKKWAVRKQAAATSKAVLKGPCPAWLRVAGDHYELIPERAAVVRRIFDMAAAGQGVRLITATLNREGVKPIGRRPAWNTSYVRKVLANPACVGTYQPMKGTNRRGGTRTPDGPPVRDYYPAVVSQRVFDAAQGAKSRQKGGRPSKHRVNVFGGLLRDARDGSTLHQSTFNYKGGRSYPAIVYPIGDRGRMHSYPLDVFEAAVLSRLKEIDPKEIIPTDRSGDEVLALEAQYADAEARLAKIKARLKADDEVDTLIELVREMEREKKDIGDRLATCRAVAASPLCEAWGRVRTLADALADAPDEHAARVKLRAVLRRIVAGVWVVFARPGGRTGGKVAGVQVWFDGGRHRDYLVVYVPAHGNRHASREAVWSARSFADAALADDLDLRDRDHAAGLDVVLNALDPKVLATTSAATA